MASHEEAKNVVLKLAVFYGLELDPDMQLPLYAKVLEPYPVEQLNEAMNLFVKNPANDRFPIPPHKIMQEITGKPQDDETAANEVASLIRNAIVKFGCGVYLDNEQRGPFLAKVSIFLGQVGWAVVEREGGWEVFCKTANTSGSDPRILQAQLRDLAKSVMAQSRAGTLGEAPALPQGPPGSKSKAIKSFATHAMRSLPPSDRDDAEEPGGAE